MTNQKSVRLRVVPIFLRGRLNRKESSGYGAWRLRMIFWQAVDPVFEGVAVNC